LVFYWESRWKVSRKLADNRLTSSKRVDSMGYSGF